ncbi:MAG: glycosyltransferase family 2 protein [Paracoccaceae bacterium]|jgi:glycosyltransferase involved in cell wall biosynthesis|nr:glycosyltransferase family 2 protein [Paracoccaceae bacterium]
METTRPKAPARSVVVFAHNEAERIAACLGSLQQSGLGPNDPIFVVINGTTDNTASVVESMAKQDKRIKGVVIALGDKANAWSYYANHLAVPDTQLHFFVDGDVVVSPGAISAIGEKLAAHPEALAASTLPRGGRTAPSWSNRILREHGMPGNFYALRGETLARIRALSINLPVGLIGDDPFLRWLILNNFNPNGPVDRSRIRPVPEAHFNYTSIPLTNWRGLRALVARQMRYQLRDLQMNLLLRHLRKFGLGAIPRRIDSLYDQATPMLALKGKFTLRKVAFYFTYRRVRAYRSRPSMGPAWYET